jgi:hypothetical protein
MMRREQFESQIPRGESEKAGKPPSLCLPWACPGLALATGASGCLAGQVIPISGGWVT